MEYRDTFCVCSAIVAETGRQFLPASSLAPTARSQYRFPLIYFLRPPGSRRLIYAE